MSMFDKHGRDYLGSCADCHGPIYPKGALELVLEALAFDIWMTLPAFIAMDTRFGLWLLSIAGGHAFTCTCPGKVRQNGGAA